MDLKYTPIRVTMKDAWCVNALDKEADYLLSLDANRLLAGFYENAGLKTPYVRYGGWESGLIGGHTLGHFLSALSLASTNSGIARDKRLALQKKLLACVKGLKECQEALGTGFLWGAKMVQAGDPEAQFDNVERGKTDIKTQAWVPWYTMHKILAGLVDAYAIGECKEALPVACKLGDWVCARVSRWDKRLQNKVLSVEYGGMNDCLYELYSLTGRENYARAAHKFDEEKLFDAILTEGKDVLNDLHANTTIPKVLGAIKRYSILHGKTVEGKTVDAERYLHVGEAFFRMVTERHTYVTGGNSEWERFGADGVLDGERTNCNCETCNVYNMLKIARLLFCITGETIYTDYYDNAFVNDILSSQNPETGMTTYFQPMASGFFKVFSTPFNSFWCCTGSGMESMAKIGDSLLYRDGDTLCIEQYLSFEAETENFSLSLECNFPMAERGILRIERASRPLRLRLRVPDWADGEVAVGKNGFRLPICEENGHVTVEGKEGDVFLFAIPVTVTLKGLPDGGTLAFRYGGAVLSADLGTENMTETTTGVDVAIPSKRYGDDRVYFPDLARVLEYPEHFLKRHGDTFTLEGGDIPLNFGLHFRRYRERYAIYLRLLEGAREEDVTALEPYDAVQCGYGQYESDELHALAEKDSVGATASCPSRRAKRNGWFSYDLAVDPSRRNVLTFGLKESENGKTLRVLVEGTEVFAERLSCFMGEDIYQKEIAIPQGLLRKARKKKVGGREYDVLTVRFEGIGGRASASVCGSIAVILK